MKKVFAFALALAILVGCAGGVKIEGKKTFDGKKDLLKRYERYWSLRAKNDFNGTYAMEAPYVRFLVSRERYMGFLGLFKRLKLAKVSPYGMECKKPFYCCIDTKLLFINDKEKKGTVEVHDCWLKYNGVWWHTMKKSPFLSLGL